MFDYEKSSGVDITSKEITFFTPPAAFRGVNHEKILAFFAPPPRTDSDPSGWRWRLEYF